MRQGIVRSLTKQLLEACERAERTGEGQWIEIPTLQVRDELPAALDAARDNVYSGSDRGQWLRKFVSMSNGVRIEVRESHRVSKGLPSY